jgi:hypothetical protein
MPTRYLDAQLFGQPRDGGLDGDRRQVFTFTVLFRKVPSGTFAEEMVALLVAAGVGIFNEDLFMSSSASLPLLGTAHSVAGFLHLVEGGGTSNERIHNTTDGGYERPSLVVRAIAEDSVVCRDKARRAYETLVSVCNQTVTFS